ncbi:tail protein X [Paraburkholderia sp.]|uniref:tail protein X n=1 Tax=Paraburkholderia TaxID=1822464 RepID=UPI0025F4585A|nr:tail protein X [Paraburkholderia sp.]
MFLSHVTRDGERWDQLSYHYYGTPFEYERIVGANPDVPITPALPGGLLLAIPVIATDELTGDLPPWMR